MDTSTLLVVFLLVTAATVASYALSHWSSIRGVVGVGWAATSVGTTMLLIAAAIVVLTFVFRGPLWRPNLGNEQQLREAAAAAQETSRRLAASPFAAAATAAATETSPTTPARGGRSNASPAVASGKEQTSKSSATRAADSAKPTRSSPPLPAFNDGDPWAATRCVYAYNPGSDPTEWRIYNDCGVPVGISISPDRAMVLPAPAQRPVTLAEQTVRAGSVRYVACFVATAEAINLIGAPSEERSASVWRLNDSCLMRVQGGKSVP